MRSTKAELQKRREDILNYLIENGETTFEEAASYFSVSTLTIRRDIEEFRKQNIIDVRNGNLKINREYRSSMKNNEYSKERAAIQKKAATFVCAEDVLFINTSYTALGILKYINNIFCTIITNNTNILNIEYDSKIIPILCGGEIREPRSSVSGEIAKKVIRELKANKCFIGVDGVSLEGGLSSSVMHEAVINETMLKACTGKRYIVVTSDKFNKVSKFYCGGLNMVDCIITDVKANPLIVKELENQGIEVVLVTPR